ncbi:MAG: MFS transporter [Bdellovibrionales bacterium]|nr:MFS transporter [Bdellovibrionales bacterium]
MAYTPIEELCPLRHRLLERNIHIIWTAKCLFPALALAVPTIVTFWGNHGMDMFQVMVLESFFAIVMVVGEVPAGYLADFTGRKRALQGGGFSLCLGTLWYTVASGFNEFLIAELFIAFGMSLISGADEALLFDTLKEQGREEHFSRIWGEISSIEIAVGAGALLIGGFLGTLLSLRHPFLFAAIAYGAFTIVVTFLVEADHAAEKASRAGIRDLVRVGKQVLLQNPRTRTLILIAASLFSGSQASFWLLQPYFKECGLALYLNGVVLAALSLIASVLCWHIGRIERERGFSRIVSALTLLQTGTLLLVALSSSVWLIPAFGFLQATRAFLRVTVTQRLNFLVDPHRRATSISVKNCVEKLSYSVLLIPCGAVADAHGLGAAFLLCAATTGVGVGLAFLVGDAFLERAVSQTQEAH